MAPAYPFALKIDGPAAQNRLSVLLRVIYAIPHAIIVYFLMAVIEVVTLIAWFSILFTGKFPAGLAKFTLDASHWGARACGYYLLLTDKYPPFAMGPDDGYPVRLSGAAVTENRNRVTVFFRIIMIIPHVIVLAVLGVVAGVLLLVGWIAALGTGSVPAGIHNYLAGVLRWGTRVNLYNSLLTDQYPPFSLS